MQRGVKNDIPQKNNLIKNLSYSIVIVWLITITNLRCHVQLEPVLRFLVNVR